MDYTHSSRACGKIQKGIEAVLLWARMPGEEIVVVGPSRAVVDEMLRSIAVQAETQHVTYHPNRRLVTWPNGTRLKGCVAGDWSLRGPMWSKAWVHDLCPRCNKRDFVELRCALRLRFPELFVTDCGEDEGLEPALKRYDAKTSLDRPSFQEFKKLESWRIQGPAYSHPRVERKAAGL